MLKHIDRRYFQDKYIADTLFDIRHYFTGYEDSGGKVEIECRHAKSNGISHIINQPTRPSDHIVSIQELQRHILNIKQFDDLPESKKQDYHIVIIVTIEQDIPLEKLITKMTKHDNLLRTIYKQDEPVFSDGKQIQQVTFVIMKNQ